MKAEQIFRETVKVMKTVCPGQGVTESLKRARSRSDEDNAALLRRERPAVNEIVRRIAETGGSPESLSGASQDTLDALVLRYVRNRDLFMTTFPQGIDEVEIDAVSLWAALMISPRDEDESE